MTLSKYAETGISPAIPEIIAEVCLLIPTYPDIYLVIPKWDIPGYLITRILSFHIQKQVFYPDLYRDIP